MLAPIVLRFLPFVFLLFVSVYAGRRYSIHPVPRLLLFLFMVAIVIAIAMFPEELNYDKPRYTSMYRSVSLYSLDALEFKDSGWAIYVYLCAKLLGGNVDLFYFLTSFLYMGGYYIFARHFFGKQSIGYFIILSAGCLGFGAYGVNAIRAGLALSLLLVSITMYDKKSVKYILLSCLLAFFAILIHKSMAIPVVGFVLSLLIKNLKIVIAIWVICLLASAANVDLSAMFEMVGFVDERIEIYIEGASEVSSYRSGFRIDFIIYSLVPLLLSWYFVKKKKISDDFSQQLLRMYIIVNAVWLLAIRIHYSDRLAYLSWFLIPAMVLLPITKSQGNIKSPQNVLLLVMYLFISLPLLLSLRDVL